MSAKRSPRPLTAVALVCSLKRGPAASCGELMAEYISEELRIARVKTELLRCVDYAILPGVHRIWVTATSGPRSGRSFSRACSGVSNIGITSDVCFPTVSPTTESGSSTVEISPGRAGSGMPREEYP